MQLTPNQRKILDKLGVNTTRLQWKLYQWEKRPQGGLKGLRLPAGLRWISYQHKFCLHCGALLDRSARECPSCKRRAPTMRTYQIFRLLGLIMPEGVAPTILLFLMGMAALFALSVLMQGPSAFLMPTGLTLRVFGAWSSALVQDARQYWRILSFGLMHIGAIHILFNSVALMQVGPVVEQSIGRKRMLVVITITQLAAALATHLWYTGVLHRAVESAGASGWLFGLIGFGIAYFRGEGASGRAYQQFLIRWAIYGILFGILMHANNAAHVGGMAAGLLLGNIPERWSRKSKAVDTAWTAAFWVSLALWLITLVCLAHFILTHWTPGGAAD